MKLTHLCTNTVRIVVQEIHCVVMGIDFTHYVYGIYNISVLELFRYYQFNKYRIITSNNDK